MIKNIIRYVAVFILCLAAYERPAIHAQDQPQVIEIHAKRFSFTPAEITITKGEPVTLALSSDDVTITKGKITRVDVTPQQAGTFKGQCGHFCGVGHASMVFSVQVKDK